MNNKKHWNFIKSPKNIEIIIWLIYFIFLNFSVLLVAKKRILAKTFFEKSFQKVKKRLKFHFFW